MRETIRRFLWAKSHITAGRLPRTTSRREAEICQRSVEVDAADKLKAADLDKVSFCESECVKEWSPVQPRSHYRQIFRPIGELF
jgi:hypothetical protein